MYASIATASAVISFGCLVAAQTTPAASSNRTITVTNLSLDPSYVPVSVINADASRTTVAIACSLLPYGNCLNPANYRSSLWSNSASVTYGTDFLSVDFRFSYSDTVTSWSVTATSSCPPAAFVTNPTTPPICTDAWHRAQTYLGPDATPPPEVGADMFGEHLVNTLQLDTKVLQVTAGAEKLPANSGTSSIPISTSSSTTSSVSVSPTGNAAAGHTSPFLGNDALPIELILGGIMLVVTIMCFAL